MKSDKWALLINLNRMLDEISVIEETFNDYSVQNTAKLKQKAVAQRAVTQCITTLDALKKNLPQDTLDNLSALKSINLTKTRNIASHDYDSVSFDFVFRICQRLMESAVSDELRREISRLEASSSD